MTRINTVPVELLLDQHLMAEYRELPMVPASLRRSLASPRFDVAKLPTEYTLNAGHVSFFYLRRVWLVRRWHQLIAELRARGYTIDPIGRAVSFEPFEHVPNRRWTPTAADYKTNAVRLLARYREKPRWYTYDGQPIQPRVYKQLLQTEYARLQLLQPRR